MEAIRNIFDTNSNGALDTGDERWSQFRVSVDGELKTLESLGIVSIDLTPTGSGQSFTDGSAISGMATFTRADGSTGAVGDAILVSDVNGYLVNTTSEDRTDGSTVTEIRASNQDGSLAFINVIATSADGHSILTSFDDDGNGTFDRSQTKITNQSTDGIQTKTIGNFDASGALLDQTTVTTSADRNTVTTELDHDGDGLADEEQVFAQNVDGSTSTIIRTFSKNGDVVSSLSTVTGSGGLSKATSFDLDGDSLADRVVEELTVVAGNGARTKTVTERGRDGTIVTATETATSADHRTQTTSADVDGNGTFDVIAVATRNVTAGNVTVHTSAHNQDGSLRGNAMSYVSSSGLIKNTSADVTGDGVADVLTSDITTVASNGDRTQTTQQTSADGSLLSRTVTVANAAGTNRAISIDADGDGAYDSLRTIVSNASGATDTQSSYSQDGVVLIARTITTTSADGSTKSETLDVDGDGVVDAVSHSQTIKNTNGDAVTTVTRYNGAGILQLGRTVTTVSADGLDTLVESYIDANLTVDASTRSVKSLETDGSMVETVTSLAGSTQVSVVRTVTSADRKSVTQKSYLGSFGSPWKIASSSVADDGTATTVVETFSPDGSVVISRSTALVSPDGLEATTTMDLNGDGKADTRNVDVTALTADGGRIQKLTSYAGPYVGPANRIAETTITVAGNGLGSATATDFDGDGTIDHRSSDVTVLNANGSTTRTVSDFNGGGEVLVSREVTTSSATGLHAIKEVDADGDGTVDLRTVEVVDVLADGGRTTTVSASNAANALRQKTVETISGNGLHRTSRIDLNGDGGYDRETTASIVANGDQVTSQSTFSPDGTVLVSKVVTTKSANGLSISTQSDLDGDQIFDTLERTVRKINADGSTTTTSSKFNGDGTVRIAKTSTTVSADGLVETVQTFINADELADVTTVTKKTINGDGSVTQTVDQYAGSNNTKFGRTVSSISPDGRNTSGTLAWHADLLQVQQVSGSINPDGSSTTTETTTHSYNPFASKEIKTKTVAADGLSNSTKLEVYGYEGALTYSETITSVKTLNGDGSVVEVERDTNQAGTLIDQVITTTAANGLTQQKVWSGNHVAASLTKVTTNADGSTTTKTTYGSAIANGNITGVIHELTVNRSANGLTEEAIVTSVGKVAKTQSRAVDTDGEKTTVTSFYNSSNGVLLRAETVVESADGLSIELERDTDGTSGIDYRESSVIGADGRRTLTITQLNNDATVKERSTVVVSADGLSTTSTFDTNGDGQNDRMVTDVTVLNPDGGRTKTYSEFAGDGTTLLNRKITVSSGDGLTKITQIQTTGSGITDETQYDVFTIDANGNEVQSSTVQYKDGSRRSAFTVTRMRDGRTLTNFDYNGDGVIDQYQWDSSDKTGNRQQSIGYPTGKSWRTGLGDASANGYLIAEVDNGLSTLIDKFAPDDPLNPGGARAILGRETISRSALLDGSYVWRAISAEGVVTSTVGHTLEGNNIDLISWTNVRGTSGSVRIEKSLEDDYLYRMQRIHDVAIDRDMQNSEREQLGSYILNGALNAKQIATDLLNGYEFKTYYGTLTNVAFINVVYQNAFGRSASLAETQEWLGKLNGATLTRADLLVAIADSAEHRVVGNQHTIDNVTSGNYLHSTDKILAANTVVRIFNVLLDRDPTNAEILARAATLTAGSKSQYQIAGEVLASSAFTSLYGSLSNAAFIERLFMNTFGRSATTSEMAFWTSALVAGTSRADMAVVLSAETSASVTTPGKGLALTGTTAIDVLVADAGNDFADGLAGNDIILTRSGNDTLNGGAGADTLVGGSGDDTYVVDAAGDVVVELAGEGVDTVQTALATHTLAADVENLTFTGTTAAFAGTGNSLDNVIRGGAGADTLNGGAGNDTLTGGLGNDTYVVDSIGDVVVENAGEGIDTIRTTLSSYSIAAQTEIENLTFVGSGDFTGTGNAAANVLTGGAGNDILDGGAGIDTMVGGLGNDIFVVDVATDVVTEAASGGTDEIRTALASYSLAALANVENLTYTGAEAFTGTGNAAANTIRGGSGNDTLNGGAGADTLVGGSGDDTYVVDAAGDVVVELAGEGVDTVQTALATHTLAADVENLTFTGTTAAFAGTGNSLDNVIRGGAGADTLDGGTGNDTLIGGTGIDRMIGGTGDDTLVVDVAGDIIVENAGEGTDTVQTALASYSLAALANVENLTYTGTAAFSGTGNSLDNVIRGGVAADTLDGMAGNDTLIGGLGNDTYTVDTTGDVVVENGGEGIDTVRTALSDYTLGANVENLTYTGTGTFAGTGNELDNALAGGAGADTLAGGAGNDSYVVGAGDTVIENAGGGIDTVQTALSSYTLGANVENLTFTGTGAFTGTGNALDNIIRGGAGVDTLTGGVGNDTYVVTAGDIVVENAGEGTDTIETALATYTLGDHLENLTFTGAVAFTGTGNALDNVITGGVAADRLTGGAGNDTLDGKAGTDTMIGGTGDDTYVVDNANDVVTENANEGTDEIRTSLAAYSLATRVNVENLDYTGTAAFTGTGNVSANVLRGGTGNDTLDGGAGADTLIGGLGNDIYVVDNVDDAIVEGVNEGTDTIRTALASFTLAANVENLTYTGTTVAFTGTGNILANLITGGSGADTLSGGGGDDTLNGGVGADTLIGDEGDDTYIIDNAGDVVTENANEGVDTVQTALATYSLATMANVENLTYTGTAAFTGTGNDRNNVIVGAFLQANTLDGGIGDDTLWGGLANDIYIVDSLGDLVVEDVGGGTDTIRTVVNTYSLGPAANVENLAFVGTGDFTGTGNAAANVLTGGAGNDILDGGAGIDTMIGGLGNDIFVVDVATDVVTEAASGGTDEIRTALASYSLAALANVENLTYTGAEAFTGTGNAAANTIRGASGNDTLNGGAGADTLVGGSGDDTYVVDAAGDVVVELAGEGVDTVQTALATHTLADNIENLRFTGTTAFTGTGNELDNIIVGGAGVNTLTGGAGNDILTGGAASDIFVYTAGFGHDTITNFVAAGTAHDVIEVDHAVFLDWAALLAASSQSGADTIIRAGADNSITLKNVAVNTLQSNDFRFV
ncbi:Putative hemolysin-type calcium binding protein [Neorhizobium galegae bv. officinalis]|nr:Putative hemolysin-type calcium binding protein [Neorhizobium galegae bv. officinalis]